MREDCFANNISTCKALVKKQCEGCNFYKTKKEYEDGKQKSIKRIKTLGELTIRNIEDKYYDGKRIFKGV